MAQAVLSPALSAPPRLRLRFAATIFTGAYLVFGIQPVLGKYVLPWFGGMASVWTTCMLFFQVLLLGGYLYSHLLSTRLSPKKQAVVHAFSLALATLALIACAVLWGTPLLPGVSWRPASPEHPVAHLLILLTLAAGLPYLLVSSTGPLLQNWFANSYEGESPYRLYALSNLGSLLGLISYPILLEPHFGLHAQAWIWCAGYVVFAAGLALCGRGIARQARPGIGPMQQRILTTERPAAPPAFSLQLLWFLLAALPSLMLLATTNLICQEIAVVPFLWVLPLTLYLGTLIVCFDNPRWYRREIFQTLLGVTLPFAALAFLRTNPVKPLLYLIGVFCVVLFACCMVCHGELVRLRPQPAHLTRFYLMVSAGGAAGGVFVALIAPRIFNGYWEFHLGLVGCLLLMLVVLVRDKDSWWYWPGSALGLLIALGLCFLPHLYVRYQQLLLPPDAFYTFHYYGFATVFSVCVLFLFVRGRKQPLRYQKFNLAQLMAVTVLAVLALALGLEIRAQSHGEVRRDRNFYGSLTIYFDQQNHARKLLHGQTLHGFQLLDQPRQPTSYYGRGSGIGLFLDARKPCAGPCSMRYGLIGMGVGTLAAYGRPGEVMRYYEINPQVIDYSLRAAPYFTFIRDSAARVEVTPGDARLSLERELKEPGSQRFDLLVIDAFNSDSIPVHLLTQEAMQVYLARLASADSVLAFHVSNRVLDLHPVLVGLAMQNHLSYVRVHREISLKLEELSDWVLMSRNPAVLASVDFHGHIAPTPPPEKAVFWTDDYSNLFQVLKRADE